MINQYSDFPDWTFEIDEKSAGVYEVVAKDSKGHVIKKTGVDPEQLIEESKRDAAELIP